MQAVGIELEMTDGDRWIARGYETTQWVCATLQKVCGAPDVFRGRLRKPNVRVPIPTEQNPEIDILTSIGDLSFDEIHGAALDIAWQSTVLCFPHIDDLIRIKEVTIASTEGPIAAGEWNVAGIEEARRGIARDRQDIKLLHQRQV